MEGTHLIKEGFSQKNGGSWTEHFSPQAGPRFLLAIGTQHASNSSAKVLSGLLLSTLALLVANLLAVHSLSIH